MRAFWLLCALLIATPNVVSAQRAPIENNDYQIDLFTGPVVGPGRIVGMAGAYSAIATGIDGALWNPAGYAERAEHEIDWWEWELTGGVSLGGLFTRNDFDNNGTSALAAADAIRVTLGGRLQLEHLGMGLTSVGQTYTLSDRQGTSAQVAIADTRIGGAYAFREGDLVIGMSLRGISLSVDDPMSSKTVVNFQGTGLEGGALYRPALRRYRIGAAFRSSVDSKPDPGGRQTMENGVMRAQGLILPSRVHVPWEAQFGFAYVIGEHRSNPLWRHTDEIERHLRRRIRSGTYVAPATFGGPAYPTLPDDPRKALNVALANDREAERRYLRAQPRRYVLLSGDFIVYGATDQGQSVEAFLVQSQEASGRKPSYGVRIGAESELLNDRLKVRAGSYLEPSRTNRSYYRPHGTLGTDVRLFDAWQWAIRATFTLDLAPRYFDWGIGVGFWY